MLLAYLKVMNNQTRTQVSATISPNANTQLENLSIRTGLSRSRLFDIALAKLLTWAEHIDEVTLRRIAADMAPKLGYTRRDSGFRRSALVALPATTKEDPYSVPADAALRKTVAGGKK